MSIRVVLLCIVLLWVALTLLGVLLHLVRWLLYLALLGTVVVIALGALTRRSDAGRQR